MTDCKSVLVIGAGVAGVSAGRGGVAGGRCRCDTAIRVAHAIVVRACNEVPERISCAYGFLLFRDGFLRNSRAFHFGVPRVPLGVLYTEPTLDYLKQRGGCVRRRAIVDKIHFEGGANGS